MSGEAASADKIAAKTYPFQLSQIIKEEEFPLSRIFNVDETALFYKKMPSRTYLATKEKLAKGHKAAKKRLTILFGGNASGKCKLKPLVIHTSQNPRCFGKHGPQYLPSFPVYWRSNKTAWMTSSLFKDYFNNCFMPEVKKYCEENEMPFRVLLLLDNATGHPDLSNENVRFEYLPPNTTSLIQPMDQGVISTFKAIYLKKTMQKAMYAVDEGKHTLTEFWKDFNVMNAVENIAESWGQITEKNLHGIWKNLIPECNSHINLESRELAEAKKIVEIGQKLKFDDLDISNIKEYIDCHNEPMDDDTLINFCRENDLNETSNDFDDDDEFVFDEEMPEETPEPEMSSANISEILEMVEHAKEAIALNDPNLERRSLVQSSLESAVKGYRIMLKEKTSAEKTQSTIDSFFKAK